MPSSPFSLTRYLHRVIGATTSPPATLTTLRSLMQGQMRAISFENVDVVLSKTISMEPADVVKKLVDQKRGGYCFEQNSLLQWALEAIGFKVTPLLCRVRWGKPDDLVTTYTHMCLQVEGENLDGPYLADVGFAGTNSIEPIKISTTPQSTIDGTYKVEEKSGYGYLQVQDTEDIKVWRALYCWPLDGCEYPDLVASNWFSCTFPAARFMNQFFVARSIDGEKRYILNDEYVRRKIMGPVIGTTKITTGKQLVELLKTDFDLEIEYDDKLCRYLPGYASSATGVKRKAPTKSAHTCAKKAVDVSRKSVRTKK